MENGDSGERVLKQFICENCSEVFGSRNALFRHIKSIHSEYPSTKRAKVGESEPSESSSAPTKATILTVQEDEDWYRVIVKPQGLASMGSTGEETLFSSDALLLGSDRISYKKAVPCHRLDRETGGVMICSKSKLAERRIMLSFRLHQVRKRYRAIVIGKLEPLEGIITTPISDQTAETKYRVTHCNRSLQYGWITTVDLWPLTGRKHQLRKHMQSLGHPIVGDNRYSSALAWPQAPFQFMFLWALEIDFPHLARFDPTLMPDEPAVEGEESGAENAIVSREENGSPLNSQFPERVVVSIDEPAYYEDFRRHHESSCPATEQI